MLAGHYRFDRDLSLRSRLKRDSIQADDRLIPYNLGAVLCSRGYVDKIASLKDDSRIVHGNAKAS